MAPPDDAYLDLRVKKLRHRNRLFFDSKRIFIEPPVKLTMGAGNHPFHIIQGHRE